MYGFRIAVFGWFALPVLAGASESTAAPSCFDDEVADHVLEQFRNYGPRSARHEYFGFIYVKAGSFESAVARSNECTGSGKCLIDTATAAKLLPQGARVLGEWHTHPQFEGSPRLSPQDVRGANHNLHIRCYFAFYSTPNGDIYAWRPAATSVPGAMASRLRLGNYNDSVVERDTDSRYAESFKTAQDDIGVITGSPRE